MKIHMKINIFKVIFLLAVAIITVSAVKDANAVSYATCSFYRDLTVGSRGEDVRCLQQYLQNGGYGSTFSSYGAPDGIFGQKTLQAVVQWQVSCGLPGYGYFDSASQSKFMSGACGNYGNGTVLGASTTYTALYDVNTGKPLYGNNSNYNSISISNSSSKETKAMNKIEDALDEIEDAEDEIEDSTINLVAAKQSLEDAKDDIFDAIRAYFDKNFTKALNLAEDAIDNAEDARDEADGNNNNNGTKASAQNAIDDAEDAIDDARDEIEDAEDDRRDVNDAWDLLDEAEDALDDAEDAYDDGDYDDAEDFANDAEDFADDAVDEIDN